MPKYGLGNLLLIWAKARIFASKNNLDLVVSSWGFFRLGPWLRRENKKRIYTGYFKNSFSLNHLKSQYLSFLYPKVVISEIRKLTRDELAKDLIFEINSSILNEDLFGDIRENRELIKNELLKLVNPFLLKSITKYSDPVIGIHIRRGDFKHGNPITQNIYFINIIKAIRLICNYDVPATIFTDADESEILDILSLNSVSLAEKKEDILDILILSKSRILVLSRSSTFSYWAAFLSDNIIIRPQDDWQKKLRHLNDFKEIIYNNEDTSALKELINKNFIPSLMNKMT